MWEILYESINLDFCTIHALYSPPLVIYDSIYSGKTHRHRCICGGDSYYSLCVWSCIATGTCGRLSKSKGRLSNCPLDTLSLCIVVHIAGWASLSTASRRDHSCSAELRGLCRGVHYAPSSLTC